MKIGQIEKTETPINDHWRRKYPFNKMKIDELLSIEGTEEDIHKACLAVHNYGRRNDKKFSYRKADNKLSVVIYRIA